MTEYVRSLPKIKPSLPTTPLAAVVAAGDVLAVVAMIAAGLYRHSILAWELPMHTARTAAPFLIPWIIIAPLAGAYREEIFSKFGATMLFAGGAWIVAAVLGSQLRATVYFPGNAPLSFVLVTIAFGLLFLLAWRLAVVIYRRRRIRAS